MQWNLVSDSSCNQLSLETPDENIRFSTVPFAIRVDGVEFLDDDALDCGKLVDAMVNCRETSETACPSPEAWRTQFERPGNVIALTISGALSGSYNSACAARELVLEKEPDRNIAVIDTRSTGPEMTLLIRKLQEWIAAGIDFESVVCKARRYLESTRIIFALSSYNNLIQNGRMNRFVGMLAHKLGIWGVGIGSETGTIKIRKIARGSRRAVEVILEDMVERGKHGAAVVIDHCENPEFARKLEAALLARWPHLEVTVRGTRGLCSYYAEKNGVIVGY